MNIDPDIAPTPPHCSIDAWSPQQFTWSSSADLPIPSPYSPMEQFHDYWQTAVWSVDSPPVALDIVDDLLPGMEPPGSYVNPQEVDSSDTIYATASAPPCSSVDTGYSQHSTWSSDVAPPTFTQYNPMELIQDPGQTPTWSVNSLPVAPYVDADLLPGTQPFNGDMFPPEFGPSETRCAVEVEQKGCLGPGNGERKKWQRYDERTVSTLKNHFSKTRYPSSAKKEELAHQTGLTIKQVGTWFTDHRQRDRTRVKRNRKPYERKAPTFLKQYYHNVSGGASTENSKNVDPGARPKDFRQASTSKTMVDGNLLGVTKQWSNLRQVKDERTLSILRKQYLEDPKPKMARKKDLANQTGLTVKQIGNWFSNCRRDERYAAEKKINTDAANRHSVESTSTQDSENVNPMEQPKYVYQVLTLVNGQPLSMSMANSVPIPSMPFGFPSAMSVFGNTIFPSTMAPECFQMPMQQFPPHTAMNPAFQQTATMQNPAQPEVVNFYY